MTNDDEQQMFDVLHSVSNYLYKGGIGDGSVAVDEITRKYIALRDRGGAPSIREWVIFLQIKRDERDWESAAARNLSVIAWRTRYVAWTYGGAGYHSFYNPASTWHERNDNEVYQEAYL